VKRSGLCVLWMLVLAALVAANAGYAAAQPAPTIAADQMLFSYVNAPDPTFAWDKGPVKQDATGSISDIVLTSQTWHDTTWRHLLRIAKPAEVTHPGWMALYITGGSGAPRPGVPQGEDMIAVTLAQAVGAPVAILYQVPNQPLFNGLSEDGIISYTFQEFLKDGDPTWPALFPMVKSAVRAMDAIQQYAKQEWKEDINSFIVFGGSKRGWTTWLTGAYDGGKRVKAIAPAVIDILNMRKQLPHQLELWGKYSEMIDDYTSKGLQDMFGTPRGNALWVAVDPYTYRARITMPKLILRGANDPYWNTDALNLYWDDLVGPKYTLDVPNVGHGLNDPVRLINTLGAFIRTVASGKTMPDMSWKLTTEGDKLTITVNAPQATGARAWVATSDNLDFRPQRWVSTEMQGGNGVYSITIQRPPDKNIAAYGEVDFLSDGKKFTLSTQNAILKK
jgi:PhoPQ-activated pathogenicity-related protein